MRLDVRIPSMGYSMIINEALRRGHHEGFYVALADEVSDRFRKHIRSEVLATLNNSIKHI